MKTTKVLLYCTKNTPYLVKDDFPLENKPIYYIHYKEDPRCFGLPLNGKIVAQCEVETEEIENSDLINKLTREELLNKSCLTETQLSNYLNFNNNPIGYTLHIKNLEELKAPLTFEKNYIYKEPHGFSQVCKAPQNMMRVYDRFGNKYILISIRPEWLCKILNGDKTIEVRKKVLKEML